MTPKERILNAITGKPVDRVPWSPFLAYWWEAQCPERIARGQLAFLEEIGADPLLRGFGHPWKLNYHHLDIEEHETASERLKLWNTPVGTLKFRYVHSGSGNTWFLVDHPVKAAEDLKILSWVYEHAEVVYDPASDTEYRAIGDRGLIMPLIGSELKTCFQSMVETYAGIQILSYLLADVPEEVEACLAAMRRVSDQTARCCAQAEAETFIFWEDSSTTSISPALFRKYTAPEISCWADMLHKSGKLLIHHACGHLRALLKPMAETGADCIESISPPTTGNIDIDEAFAVLPENIALIGGIEPVFFRNCEREALCARVDSLLETAKGRRYVLANSDSCPPDVAEWKLRFVSNHLKGV